jgi:ABC-type phosphate transport system substrate-binding protein
MPRLFRALVAAAALVACPACAEFVVVVNPKNPVSSLTARQVAQIYLGRVGSFAGGGQATPIDLPEGTPLRDEFYAKVAEKNAGQVKAYWSKQLFSGNGTPPREVASIAEVKRAVAGDATAIGYIDRAALDASVKEIFSVR